MAFGWVAVLAFVGGALGCSSGDAVRPSPRWADLRAEATSPSSPPTSATASGVCSARPMSIEPRSADPEGESALLTSLTGPSVQLDPRVDPSRATKLTLLAFESTARAEGITGEPSPGFLGAELREGQQASTPVSIEPGACVTYVAHGGLGAASLDLYLTQTPPGGAESAPPLAIFAAGRSVGPIAVIGGRDGCVRSPVKGQPWSGQLHVRMRRGSGLALVQTYRI